MSSMDEDLEVEHRVSESSKAVKERERRERRGEGEIPPELQDIEDGSASPEEKVLKYQAVIKQGFGFLKCSFFGSLPSTCFV